MLNDLYAGMISCFQGLVFFIRHGDVPVSFYRLVPTIMSIASLYFGIKLLRTLKPGMVCRASLGCDRCELLYAVGLGSSGVALLYILLLIKAWATDTLHPPASSEVMLHCLYDTAGQFFAAWVSYRCLGCLVAHKRIDLEPVCKGRNK